MSSPVLRPYGDRAVLVEVATPLAVTALRSALSGQDHPAVRSVVPAARSVLIEFDPAAISRREIADLVDRCSTQAPAADTSAAATVEIEVRYDGADLEAVAMEVGESSEVVVARHLAGRYTVQFCGFSPGFAYLIGLDPVLRVPRLATPRAEVPAGSVGVAGEFTGIYPRASPGGWRLLGSTDAVVFDIGRRPPALLPPGAEVRFVRA